MNSSSWRLVNQKLVAKAIGELTFEQIFAPQITVPAKSVNNFDHYCLQLENGIQYFFEGKMGIWNHLKVRPETLKRKAATEEVCSSAAQFFIDSQHETKMTDIILGNFLEEMHNTLYSDLVLLQKQQGIPASEMALWDGDKLQAFMDGHPKIILNKGRIGWGAKDLAQFSPESERSFKLYWIALKKSVANISLGSNVGPEDVYLESLSTEDLSTMRDMLKQQHKTPEDYFFTPVHPWQWNQIIQIQFVQCFGEEIIPLGEFGDFYRPQISIRTLANASRPEKSDVKLPLPILNTSCIRGLPAKYVALGPQLSERLSLLCSQDAVLSSFDILILTEKAGISFEHPAFKSVVAAPYRYHEYLGAIWRKSSASCTQEEEKIILTAALFHEDFEQQPLIGEYIKRSGLSISEWLKEYFKVSVLPLFHLQSRYGIGIVAHGQNIMLKLKNFVPVGIVLKDFQGDLRLSSDSQADFGLPSEALTRLPPHYLIHDLITGHFITVLRFISEATRDGLNFPEEEFYKILGETVLEMTGANQNLLMRPKYERVLLNKVRFKIGYADNAERPLPLLGEDLVNPLYSCLRQNEVFHE